MQDVLSFNWKILPTSVRLVGNLPYNIASHILRHLFTVRFSDAHFLLQKEVALRLSASPKQTYYSALSVFIQAFFHVEKLFIVPPEAFYPKPKVMSAFVRIVPSKTRNQIHDWDIFFRIVKKAFSHRRKKISNNLCAEHDILKRLSIDPFARAQELDVGTYIQISNQLK